MDAFRLANKLLRSLTFWNARRIWYLTRTQGPMAVLERARFAFGDRDSNALRELEARPRALARQRRTPLAFQPRVGLAVACIDTPLHHLQALVASVGQQTFPNWRLSIAVRFSDENILDGLQELVRAYPQQITLTISKSHARADLQSEAFARAEGDFVGLLNANDVLLPNALYELVARIGADRAIDFVYGDEGVTDDAGVRRLGAILKPDFAPDTLRGSNYIGHLALIRRDLWRSICGLDPTYQTAAEYDLMLRASENAQSIAHVSKVILLQRAAANADTATLADGQRAIAAHLERLKMPGRVESGLGETYRVHYELKSRPKVSIIIPNKDHASVLETGIASIVTRSTYANFEIVIVENNSALPATHEAYRRLQNDPRIRVIADNGPFNFSRLVNLGAKHATGEFLLLLNNDTEVIAADWIERMLEFGQRDDVGAVGAKLLYPNQTTQHAGVIVGIQGLAGHIHRGLDPQESGYLGRLCTAQNLSAVTAACMLIRKSIYDAHHGFDPAFAIAYNDVDFCLRLRAAGKLIVWTPDALLYHYESLSRGSDNAPENTARHAKEIALFQERWREVLRRGDPYYNPNLSHLAEDCRIATPFDGLTMAYPVDG